MVLHVAVHGGLEYREGPERVGIQVTADVLHPEAHVRVRGEVVDQVAARHGLTQGLRVEDVTAAETEPRAVEDARQAGQRARRQVVERDHRVALRHQPVAEMAPDEAGTAGHEHPRHAGDSGDSPRSHAAEASCGQGRTTGVPSSNARYSVNPQELRMGT